MLLLIYLSISFIFVPYLLFYTVNPASGDVFYAANPGFSHPKQIFYSITIRVKTLCGTDTEVLTLEIYATQAPQISVDVASVNIYEDQVIQRLVNHLHKNTHTHTHTRTYTHAHTHAQTQHTHTPTQVHT